MLCHPDEHRRDPVCKSSSHRSYDHEQQERADQSGEQRGYKQPDHLRNFLFKENVQLCRHNTNQQCHDNTALETDQINRNPEDMKRRHFHCPLCRRAGIGKRIGQHDTADHNTHDRAPAKSLNCTVSYTQRKESENGS